MGLYNFEKNRQNSNSKYFEVLRGKLLLMVVLLLGPVIYSGATTLVVEGGMSFRFRVESENRELLDDFFEYENNSNSQKVVQRGDGYVVVETHSSLEPLETEVPFPATGVYEDPDLAPFLDYSTSRKGIEVRRGGGELIKRKFVEVTPLEMAEIEFLKKRAEQISAEANYQHQAVEMIMRHTREHVSYTLRSSSNPADVLRTGRAYCEGYANVAALLLRMLGIPAKVVDSYIPPGHMWGYGQEGAGGFHAHVEVYYVDAGWVSYDPQATVHFVDPFHIVEYPRERTRLTELSQSDNRRITDILDRPSGWDNYFQRDTTEERRSPILVGTIYDSDGHLVSDSFRNNVWVYLRKSDGSGEGVRILPTGEFALSLGNPSVSSREAPMEAPLKSPLEAPMEAPLEARSFFYRDGKGGWVEQELGFNGKGYLKKTYRLDDPAGTITLIPGDRSPLYLWYPTDSGRWSLDRVNGDQSGRIRLIATRGEWIVSTDRSETAAKYRLDASELSPGREYFIADLPRYLEPDRVYIELRLPDLSTLGETSGEEGNLELTFLEMNSARRYSPLKIDGIGTPVVVPDSAFHTLVLQGSTFLAIRQLNEDLPPGRVSSVEVERNTRHLVVKSPSPDYPFYLAVKRGRRFSEIARSRTGSEGKLDLYIDTSLIDGEGAGEEGDVFFLLHGTPVGSKRIELAGLSDGLIDLEQ